jgi:hypothetical protein
MGGMIGLWLWLWLCCLGKEFFPLLRAAHFDIAADGDGDGTAAAVILCGLWF